VRPTVQYWTLVPQSQCSPHKTFAPNECRQSLAGDWGTPREGPDCPSLRLGPSTLRKKTPPGKWETADPLARDLEIFRRGLAAIGDEFVVDDLTHRLGAV
jgi:hypothetical protein